MGTIGILHSGPREIARVEIDQISNTLKEACKNPPVIEVPDWSDNLLARAKSLIQKKVAVIYAKGGSRAAHAAIHARGSAKAPIVVFSSVAPYILDEIDPAVTTGVCAHTSDHDDDRLDWLLKMLQYGNPTIGVLYSTNRGDTSDQYQAIADAAEGRCTLVPADLNGPITFKKAFELFHDKQVDGLLVAADPYFYRNLKEVVDRANRANYPAIYQWSEFVTAGGLMSFGPNLDDCYKRADKMVADIQDGKPIPPVYEVPDDKFELVVSQSKADHFNRWPLSPDLGNDPRLVVK